MAGERKFNLSFGNMEVELQSVTARNPQIVNLVISGIHNKIEIEKLPSSSVVFSDRLIAPEFRAAAVFIANEAENVAIALGCEKNDFLAVGGVRHGYEIPNMTFRHTLIPIIFRTSPEYMEAETKNTKTIFDAIQKRLEEIKPEVEEILRRAAQDKTTLNEQNIESTFVAKMQDRAIKKEESIRINLAALTQNSNLSPQDFDQLVEYVVGLNKATTQGIGRSSASNN